MRGGVLSAVGGGDINGLVRFGGYLGFVLFAGGIALVAFLPKAGRMQPNPALDAAVRIIVIGYGVMLLRAFQLIVVAEGWTRRLAGMVLVAGMLTAIAFVGISLLLQDRWPPASSTRRETPVDTISTVDIVSAVSEEPHLGDAALLILIALARSERHGYAIMREVELVSQGRTRLAPGTLYTNIKRLLAAGLIEETEERVDRDAGDERRRYYRLSARGQQALAAEVDRMELLVSRARPWLRGAS